MNIIINNNEFNYNNIFLKNNDKILYNFHDILLLGIPLILKEFDYDIIDNYIKIKCKNLLSKDLQKASMEKLILVVQKILVWL